MKHLLEDANHTNEAIKLLKSRDDKLYIKIYDWYREEFVVWGYNNSTLNKEDVQDAFQDAIIVLFKKLDKISPESTIIGFLWQSFKYKLMHKHRGNAKVIVSDEIISVEHGKKVEENDFYRKLNNEHLKNLFKEALNKLGEPCKSILTLKFYKDFEGAAIADEMDYKNAPVVHAKTYNCIRELKGLLEGKI